MRILYLHPAGPFGGASKSLVEMFSSLREQYGVQGSVLTPKGSATEAFSKAGLAVSVVRGVSQFDNTRYGHYRRLRWLILLRELFYLPGSLLAIWRLRDEQFDVLHVNEVTLLPLGIWAKKLLGLPMVVHVRSLQCAPQSNWRTRIVNRLLGRYADAVVSIDHTVAQTLDSALTVDVVHNGLRVEIVEPTKRVDTLVQPVRVGFMGVLLQLKGIYELVEAMRILKDRGVPIECVVAGENARNLYGMRAWVLGKLGFAKNVRAELDELVQRYGLESHVHFLGFVKDVRALYPTIDILCFPSHLNAAGRPVFEAAFYGIPSVVAVKDPLPDAVLHEQTGLAISEPSPELLAEALQRLAEDTAFRHELGHRARVWALQNFSIESSAKAMMKIYKRLKHSA